MSVKIPQHVTGNVAENSMGGTELTSLGLFSRLPDNLKDGFEWVISRYEKELEGKKPALYWVHDLPQDPMHDHLKEIGGIDKFEKIIFSSHWHMQMFKAYLQVPYHKSIVMKTAIDTIPEHKKPKNEGKLRLAYFSTPQRGLDVLLTALEMLDRDDFVLDVYSSFKLYGWEKNDEPYKPLFERCEELEYINYIGTVPHKDMLNALKKSHILAYPSTWEETSCRVVMEAMSAKMAIVAPNYGALPETCTNYSFMYQWDERKLEHAEAFADVLEDVLDSYWEDEIQEILSHQKWYADKYYSWDYRIDKWIDFLVHLKEKS